MAPLRTALIGTDQLPLAELCAARLDGELYALAGLYCPVDLPEFPALRAESLRPIIPARGFVERLSAAWVHGAIDTAPVRAQFALPSSEGVRPSIRTSSEVRQVVIGATELMSINGCLLTTPVRTIADLLLDATLSDERAITIADRLARQAGCTPSSVRAALLARYRLPGMTRAESRLASWRASFSRR